MTLRITALCALLLFATPALLADEKPPGTDQSTWELVQALYETAKETGEQVPKDVYAWVKEDFGKIGDWEYHVVELSLADPKALEAKLNELGAERWECIWIQATDGGPRFVFKRPAKSYLKNVPVSQLMKLVPVPGSGGEAE